MICTTLRLAVVPAFAAVMVFAPCTAFAQGSDRPLGFLNEIFGNSDRFSPPSNPSRPSPQAQQPHAQLPEPSPAPTQGRVAQMPGSEITMRLDRLEAQIRQLTGAIEQLQYRNQQLETHLRRMQGGDAPARPSATPPAVQPPQAAPPPSLPQQGPPAGRRGDVFDPAQNPNAPGAPRVLGTLPAGSPAHAGPPAAPPVNPNAPQAGPDADDDDPVGAPGGRAAGAPLDLSSLIGALPPERPAAQPGTAEQLPAPPARNPSGAGAQVATLPPSNSPRDSYDLAYGYIMRKDYALAEDAFRNFIDRYPSDRLAPDAHYWFGESMFQRQRYRDAAEAFLNVSTKFENSARAPDSLLRLGQSLAAMGEREAACASLAEVLRKYPRASVAIKQGVEREQRRVRC